MTEQSDNNANQPDDEWEIYLNVFLDESDDDLESLTQALLRLENDPKDIDSLNEAFRLLHTHKGSAGLMGFEGISELAHQLENRFEGFRSGSQTLDARLVTLLLRCVDFLKDFNSAMRHGKEPNQDASQLLDELVKTDAETGGSETDDLPSQLASELPSVEGGYRVVIEFEYGLQLADMKARLIVARLENIGDIVATIPAVDEVQSVDQLTLFSIAIQTNADQDKIQQIANVDGVKSVQIEKQVASEQNSESKIAPEPDKDRQEIAEAVQDSGPADSSPDPASEKLRQEANAENQDSDQTAPGKTESRSKDAKKSASPNVSETVRVGIDRLDKLMNLTGELVVNKARLSQLVKELVYDYRSAIARQYDDDWCEHFRAKIGNLQDALLNEGQLNGSLELLERLKTDIDALDERFSQWESIRQKIIQVAESADQLDSVSGNLQQSVLDTRMVPVAPLFNRFRRVIRDLADERNKKVQLKIQGESTELDKRMIDELGDPLLHLVRNSIDHGLEPPEERRKIGKPDIGQITLEASHRGNHVFISIRDDGRGLNLDKIRKRIVERGLASENQASTLTDSELTDFIWQPGFSTSSTVTDISGRGVGMDVVKNRITELNGVVEVDTVEQKGTTFTLRLPLTLAIIRSLLVRYQDVPFSIPISDVLETIAVEARQIQTAYGKELIELRGKIIPLVRMGSVFKWHFLNRGNSDVDRNDDESLRVVIVHAFGQTIGLAVDELFGSSDIVVKSLADNFEPVRGLSGASILGDGNVNLMIDSSEVIKMASESSSR